MFKRGPKKDSGRSGKSGASRPKRSDSGRSDNEGSFRAERRSDDSEHSGKRPYTKRETGGGYEGKKERTPGAFGSKGKRSDDRRGSDDQPKRVGGSRVGRGTEERAFDKRPTFGTRREEGDAPRGKRAEGGFGGRTKREDGDSSERRSSYGGRREENSDRKPRRAEGGFGGRDRKEGGESSERRSSYGGRREENNDRKPRRTEGGFGGRDRKEGGGSSERRSSYGSRREESGDRKPRRSEGGLGDDRRGERSDRPERRSGGGFSKAGLPYEKAPLKRKDYTPKEKGPKKKTNRDEGLIRLNKYMADAGIASRRKADELISLGEVSVNGVVVTELGHKVNPGDEVRFGGRILRQEKLVYVLLNKPKDYLTTTDDPHERRTVMELVKNAGRERIFPVGRLDRNTTGLLLLTNDGELAEKLMHPRNNIQKLYHVTLDKSCKKEDFEKLKDGLELEDGPIKPDEVAFVEGATKKEIGISLHSGRNRIVRRIFEHLGYEVVRLDRVIYAGLTKRDLPRGKWRHLSDREVRELRQVIKLSA